MTLSLLALAMLTGASFVLWSSIYWFFSKLHPYRPEEWNYHIVVLIHTVTILLSIVFGFINNPFTDPYPGADLSSIHDICIMVVCLGYFLFDFTWCIRFYESKFKLMMLHQIVFLVIISTSLVSGHSGTDVRVIIFFSELSNPMLHIRYFMRKSGITDGILYELNDVMFVATFAVCRLGIGSYYMYCLVLHKKPKLLFMMSGIALYLVSLATMINISVLKFRRSPRLF